MSNDPVFEKATSTLYDEINKTLVEARRRVIEQLNKLGAGKDITFTNEFILRGNWNDQVKIIGIDDDMFVVMDENEEHEFLEFDNQEISTEMLLAILIDVEAGKYTNTEDEEEQNISEEKDFKNDLFGEQYK